MTTIHPLQVNALFLDKPEQVIGQDIRFENIPWMNTEKDVFENPNTPLETNSIIPRPFSYDNAIYLEKGVHLHFILPTHFKKFDEQGNLPAVPNRWYIKNESSSKVWIIESDYIWNINDSLLDKNATCTFVEGEAGKDFNFHYVGRKYEFEFWQKRQKATEFREFKRLKLQSETDSNKKRLAELISKYGDYLNNLTAMGWGSLSFDVHYPNCRSMFGFHDEDGKIDDIYSIVGWVENYSKEERKAADNAEPIVVGKFNIVKDNKVISNSVIADKFTISIANTLPEAIASLIIQDVIPDEEKSLTDKLTLEEQFQALINFDTLNDQKLDLVSRLRHNLHEKQFYQTKGVTKWQFKDLGVHSKINQILQLLYNTYTDEIVALNEDQKQYDLDSFKFYSLLESLYLDWSNYLQELYVENKDQRNINEDLSALRAKYETLIRFQNQLQLEFNQILSQKLHIENLVKGTTYDSIKNFTLSVLGEEKNITIDNQDLSLDELIKRIRKTLSDIILEQVNDINFEHALPPSVVISSNKIINNTSSNKEEYQVRLKNLSAEIDKLHENADIKVKFNYLQDKISSIKYNEHVVIIENLFFEIYTYLQENSKNNLVISADDFSISKFESTISKILEKYIVPTSKIYCNSWNIYKVQWHSQFLPKKEGYYLENQNNEFLNNFIDSSYQLDEQNADLIKRDEHAVIAYSNNENNYYGESFVDDTIQDYLIYKIDASLSSTEAAIEPLKVKLDEYKTKLKSLNLVTLTLSDFNNLMTQRSTALSVLPLIPNGFKNHQELANNLSVLFTEHKENVNLFTPNRLSTFNPLRNGALRIAKLRAIDSFGRVQFLNPDGRVLTTKQQTIKHKPDWVNLPPRLMQSAALNIDILKTKTELVENPVIGYLLPSYLNQHLQFFDAKGSYLGAINEEGKWEPTPFDVFLATTGDISYKSCKNTDLVKAIDWFLAHAKNNPAFRSRMIQEIQTNLEHVQPENYQNPSLLETISSVPLAITKLSYELITKGELRYDIASAKDITFSHTQYQNKLDAIQFPIRFGDINQYNDGLIGYWHDLNVTDTFFINSETVRTFTDEVKIIKSLSLLTNLKTDNSFVEIQEILQLILTESRISSNIPVGLKDLNKLMNLNSAKLFTTDFSFLKDKSAHEIIESLLSTIKNFESKKLVKLLFETQLNNLKSNIKGNTSLNKYLSIILPHLQYINEISKDKLNTSILNKSELEVLTLGKLDFKSLYSDKIQPIKHIIEDLKQGGEIDNVFEFLIEIINKKGHITKADVLKHFVEHGNKVWKVLQQIGLINIDKTILRTTVNSQTVIALASKKEDKNNHVLLNDKPQFIYALMHPKAKVFFKTGVLPEKHIILPYDEIKKPLRKIELTLLTSPVLTPKDNLELSLAQDSRYKWSWIELEKAIKGKALPITNKPIKKRIPQELALDLSLEIDGKFNRDAEKYKSLSAYIDVETGDFFPEEHIYYLNVNEYQKLISENEKFNYLKLDSTEYQSFKSHISFKEEHFLTEEDSYIIPITNYIEWYKDIEINDEKLKHVQLYNDLNCINKNLLPKISSFNTSSATIPQLVLKEGWLSLKPTKI